MWLHVFWPLGPLYIVIFYVNTQSINQIQLAFCLQIHIEKCANTHLNTNLHWDDMCVCTLSNANLVVEGVGAHALKGKKTVFRDLRVGSQEAWAEPRPGHPGPVAGLPCQSATNMWGRKSLTDDDNIWYTTLAHGCPESLPLPQVITSHFLQQRTCEQHVAGHRSNVDHSAKNTSLIWLLYISMFECLILAHLDITQSTCSEKNLFHGTPRALLLSLCICVRILTVSINFVVMFDHQQCFM